MVWLLGWCSRWQLQASGLEMCLSDKVCIIEIKQGTGKMAQWAKELAAGPGDT